MIAQNQFCILLADDDDDDREFFRLALEKVNKNARLFTVANGAQAVAFLQKQAVRFDLVFLDINMPLMDGVECLAAVRQLFSAKDLPIVMLSTSGAADVIERCLGLGADFYLKKPPSLDELSGQIHFCLSNVMNGLTPATRTLIGSR